VFLLLLFAGANPHRTDAADASPEDGPTVAAQPAGDVELDGQIRDLVRKLDADQLATRNEAEHQLIQLGPPILDRLPPLNDDRMSPEVKHRLARVREQLERALADSALKATVVTLKGESIALDEVIEALLAQTGNKLTLRDENAQDPSVQKLKLEFANTPFWEAVDQLLDQAKLTVYPFAPDQALAIVPAESSQRPRFGNSSYSGPFRFEAVRVEAYRELRAPDQQGLRVHLEIAWEPRLAPIGLTQTLAAVQAVDTAGSALEVSQQEGELSPMTPSGTTAVRVQIPFKLPPRSVTRIAQLRGKLQALLPGRTETFRFERIDRADAVEKRKAAVTVTLDSVRQNNELWEVRLRVRYDDAGEALESHRGWIFKNPCYLADAGGKRFEHAGFETTRQTETEVGVAYLFEVPQGLKRMSLVYETPASIVTMPVEYELRDIDLP
jgi:hypothetical protein